MKGNNWNFPKDLNSYLKNLMIFYDQVNLNLQGQNTQKLMTAEIILFSKLLVRPNQQQLSTLLWVLPG